MLFWERFINWLADTKAVRKKEMQKQKRYVELKGDLRQARQKMDSLQRLVSRMQHREDWHHDNG